MKPPSSRSGQSQAVLLTETVYWHLQPMPALESAVVSLNINEQTVYQAFRFETRQKAWLIGRYAAKTLLSQVLPGSPNLAEIEIKNDQLGAPFAFLKSEPIGGCLSLSHSDDLATAAYAPLGTQIGIDIERVATRTNAFIRDYFTGQEVSLVDSAENTAHTATLIWSAKESALKALGLGLRLDTRKVEISSIEYPVQGSSQSWNQMGVRSSQFNQACCAYWRDAGDHVVTVVILKDSCQAIQLREASLDSAI